MIRLAHLAAFALGLGSALALAACGGGGGGGDAGPPPFCTAGATQACYTGPAGTQGVGACHAGARTCLPDGSAYGGCAGEVLPAAAEVCGNGVDDDCNGAVDDSQDVDADGWTACGGDCDDGNPLVNPGAFDLPGNGVDDDCDGTSDNAAAACGGQAVLAGVTPADLAQALDLCQSTTVGPPLPSRRWGLISAALTLADGTSLPAPAALQAGVMTQFGPGGLPQAGATMAAISTGAARAEVDPGFVSPFTGYDAGTSSGAPPDLLAAHGNALPPAAACGAAVQSSTAFDPVRLLLRLRAPTNAQGLSFRFRFFASDWPDTLCSQFNDLFVAQLVSSAPGIPADRNLAFTLTGDLISVNAGAMTSCDGCPAGTAALVGTGYLAPRAGGASAGGATGWLEATAPVRGGEELLLSFTLWDAGDHAFDSLVLLDAFQWRFEPTLVGTSPAP